MQAPLRQGAGQAQCRLETPPPLAGCTWAVWLDPASRTHPGSWNPSVCQNGIARMHLACNGAYAMLSKVSLLGTLQPFPQLPQKGVPSFTF